ncbi:cation:proton antiporter [Parahaliea mediterranea]|uniref:Cation:proton antiporter n=1 Tax=Parahaliea mediterranea TaxID=651086 RepID=A0A939DIM7_9GAMM|nr:cation:proton antiporter [Parahaliea mediterranea]MBN7798846.1 cation:proton antiporter [Parahaliea mediterranea]
MHSLVFEDLLVMMAAALVAALLLRRLGLPNILSYLLAGCVIGPHVTGWVGEPESFAFVAEFGVVLLLFSIGLEFSLSRLLALRGSVFGVGGFQVVLCALLFGAAVYLWGTTVQAAVVIAGALALSSTAIVIRELSSLGQLHQRHGQLAVGVLLFQDLAAIIFLILVPVLAGAEEGGLASEIATALLRGAVLFAILMSVGKWLLPPLYREIARAHSEEIFVISTLVIVLLAAWLTHGFGLSMALGGFVIGMMLGESSFRHQIDSDIRGFKDILLALFFITIGMDIQVDLLLDYWPRLLLFAALLMLVKTALIALVVGLTGEDRYTALRCGLNLAQSGEFAIALLALGQLSGVVPADHASFIVLVAILTMAVSPLLLRYSERITPWLLHTLGVAPPVAAGIPREAEIHQGGHVIVGGYGRIGRVLAGLLEENQVPYIAIDNNVAVVDRARAEGRNVLFGDSANLQILRSCHIDSALLAVLTFRSLEQARAMIAQMRSVGINTPVIVRCHEQGHVRELLSLGANRVVPEMQEASLAIGAQMLELLDVDHSVIRQQLEARREHHGDVS